MSDGSPAAGVRSAHVGAVVGGLSAVLLVATVTWLRRDLTFMVNDDVLMAALASGSYTGTPTAHLVFIGAGPAIVLATMYRVVPSVPWYGLLLIVTQVVAVGTVVACASVRRHALRPGPALAGVALLLGVWPMMVISLSFTATAVVAAGAGALVLAASVRTRRSGRLLATAAALFAAGAAVRWDAVVGVAVVLLPTLAWILVALGRRRALVALGVLAATLGVVAASDAALRSRGDWPEYHALNDVRGQLHGTPRLAAVTEDPEDPRVARMLQANGWTIDEVYMFGSWFFDDPELYSRAQLERLAAAAPSSEARASVAEGWRLVHEGRTPLLVLAAVAASTSMAVQRRRGAVLIALQAAWAGAVFVAIAVTQRFPDRLAVPLLFVSAAAVVIAPAVLDPPPSAGRLPRWVTTPAQAIGATVALALVAWPLSTRHAEMSVRNGQREAALAVQLDALRSLDADGRFVVVGDAVELDAVDPFGRWSPFDSDRLISTGWQTFSPAHEQRKSAMGLGGSLFDHLLDDGVYLVAWPGVAELIGRAYGRHVGRIIHIEPVGTLLNGAQVVRLG